MSERATRSIIREVPNEAVSSKRVKANLELACSDRTTRRVIKRPGSIVYMKKSCKPILSEVQYQARVAWASAKLEWATR